MAPLGNVSDHITLVRRMARATGTNLSAAMQDGTLATDDWARMVTNCRGCTCAETCRSRLTTLDLMEMQTSAPEYCENRATFDQLVRQRAE